MLCHYLTTLPVPSQLILSSVSSSSLPVVVVHVLESARFLATRQRLLVRQTVAISPTTPGGTSSSPHIDPSRPLPELSTPAANSYTFS